MTDSYDIHECNVHNRHRRTGDSTHSQSGGNNADDNDNANWTSVHLNALDAIVSHNSLFTGAVFTGFGTSSSSSSNFCSATNQMQQDMISLNVYALTAFLFSSLVALALKQSIRMAKPRNEHAVRVDRSLLRAGLMATAVSSVCGVGFLMFGLINLVQIKLGRLGCGAGATATAGAIVPLVTFVPAAMLIYSIVVLHAFSH
ncbi:hypothetical protein LUZ60_004106 [Juncus effusus]|nr:hypothetical protein LUZ60_004106 [Juncus effusus]